MSARHLIGALEEIGQSIWLDTIDRDLLTSGGLKRLIEEEGVRGVTTNPTIFEQAIARGTAYDAAIHALAAAGEGAAAIYEALAVEDVRAAADQLGPVFEMSGGRDGFVSIEVSPALAYDGEGTVVEARRLWAAVGRPNVMVKVPGTRQGLPAIERLVAEGINVNVTLLFSVEVYRAVIEAYLAGLERRLKAGRPLEPVHSVASFFVSRLDTEVDKRLEAGAKGAGGSGGSAGAADRAGNDALRGRAAIANAKLAYQAYLEAFYAPRFRELLARGANVQRPLWASTSTKNPAYPDTIYVDGLIGPDTVNTLPLGTLRAFADHGTVARTLDQGLDEARRHLAALERRGVSLRDVTERLTSDGVKKFADSHRALLAAIQAKLDRLAVRRLAARDVSLWPGDAGAREEMAQRLGWLDLPGAMAARVAELEGFAAEVRRAGFTRVLLLGMGGSSLAPEVFSRVFGARPGHPELAVLDTTDPGAIAAAERRGPVERTFFLVSSKSGTTLETSDLFAYFWNRTGGAGGQFAAITDPGTPLASLARERKLRRVFENPPDIGGRYSALSYFGLVPAALLGVDLASLLTRAAAMARRCTAEPGEGSNPGLELGSALAAAWEAGRDKVTFFAAPALASFGAWAEQLLAESTGKQGKGLVPVAAEPPGAASAYGKDRVFVSLELPGPPDAARAALLRDLEAAGHPVVRLGLGDPLDLGAEFYRWEVATALAGARLGINPFDQPNVAESKANTDRVLRELVAGRAPEAPAAVEPSARAGALRRWIESVRPGDYVALLAYLAPGEGPDAGLAALRASLRDALGVATTAGYGPRYLHSTGQLHKGGPPKGSFLALEEEGAAELPVPGEDYGFGKLKLAQELGDLIALERRGRPILRVKLGSGGLDEIRKALEEALHQR